MPGPCPPEGGKAEWPNPLRDRDEGVREGEKRGASACERAASYTSRHRADKLLAGAVLPEQAKVPRCDAGAEKAEKQDSACLRLARA